MGTRISFKEALVNGLRPDARAPRNNKYMSVYANHKPTQFGSRDIDDVALAVSEATMTSASVSLLASSPQIFKGKGVTLLCDKTKIFTVNESTWAVTLITTYDLHDQGETKAITTGGQWHFVDFYNTWFLFNGSCTVFQTQWEDSSKVFVQDTVMVKTGCDFKRGRMVMAGFDSGNFWSSDWQTLWETQIDKWTDLGYTLSAPHKNWIWWSSIGGGDLLHIFLSGLATVGIPRLTGGHNASDPFFMEFFKRVQSGFMPMDWQGYVHCVKPLRDHVMVYGEDGISAVTPYSDPIPTFGLQENLLRVGVATRAAVAGNLDKHVFLDADGVLWSVDNSLKLTRLGYEEFLAGSKTAITAMCHDVQFDEHYIHDGLSSWVLTKTGLAKAPQFVTSLFHTDGVAKGVAKNVGTPTTATFATDYVDGGTRRLKTVASVEVAVKTSAAVTVTLQHRIEEGISPLSTTLTGDTRGVYKAGITCVEFKVRIVLASRASVDLFDDIVAVLSDGTKMGLIEAIEQTY